MYSPVERTEFQEAEKFKMADDPHVVDARAARAPGSSSIGEDEEGGGTGNGHGDGRARSPQV